MSAAKADILARVRAALGPAPAVPEVPRAYRAAGAAPEGDHAARFCERVADYRAEVRRVAAGELEAAVGELCAAQGARRLAVAAGAPVRPGLLDLVDDDPPLSPQALDALDGVITGCALAIADTGTIVLDGGERSGRRALTLVPDYHLCVVEAAQVVPSVPDAVAALAQAGREGRPITFVSGPSATSDIELERVEGVHGPRTLHVVVVDTP
jgi:L-lactate dehydrogenase complex protein LldG